jgi:hypothetical protein
MTRRHALTAASLACVLVAPSVALADGGARETKEQTADRLFREATQLEDAGRFAAACPRLEQSNAIDPAVGTQFNLADCYEHLGRTGRALALFRSVQALAKAAGKQARELSARERADALEPRVPRLHVEVAPGADAPGLQIRVDDATLTPDAWSAGLPLDPGTHTVTATAPGRVGWSKTFEPTRGGELRVVVPRLAELATHEPPVDVSALPSPSRGGGIPTLALVTGVVGLLGLGVGAVAGGISWADHDSARQSCPTFRCTSAASAGQWNNAVTWGTVSTVAFVVGGVGVAGAGVIWLLSPGAPAPGAAGLSVHGVF